MNSMHDSLEVFAGNWVFFGVPVNFKCVGAVWIRRGITFDVFNF